MKVAVFTLISLSIVLGLVDPRQAFDGNQQSYGASSARAAGMDKAAGAGGPHHRLERPTSSGPAPIWAAQQS